MIVQITVPPHIICARGVFTVDYIIMVCGRNGMIYSIRNGNLSNVTQLSTQAISMFLTSDGIISTNMDSSLQSHSFKVTICRSIFTVRMDPQVPDGHIIIYYRWRYH